MPQKIKTREGYIVFYPDDVPPDQIKQDIEQRRQKGTLRNELDMSGDAVMGPTGHPQITIRPPPDMIEPPQTDTPGPDSFDETDSNTLEGVIKGDGRRQLSGSSLMKGRVQNVLQGMTFGTADEGLGAISATLDELGGRELLGQKDEYPNATWSQRYDAYRDHAREIDRRMMDERPGETLATQTGAAMLSGAGIIPKMANTAVKIVAPRLAAQLAERTAPLLGRAAEGAAGGVIGGGAQGFGSGEGGFENRMGQASLGAIVGGGTGGALPHTLAAATGLSRFVGNTLGDVLPSLTNPVRRAGDIMGEAMTRSDWKPGTPGGPAQKLDDMQATGAKDVALADTSENMRSLLGAATRAPGRGQEMGRKFLRNRQVGDPVQGQAGGGQWTQVLNAIQRYVSPTVSARQAAKVVTSTRSREAQAFYQKAFGHGEIDSSALRDLLANKNVRRGLARGVQMGKDAGEIPESYRLPKADDASALPVRIWHSAKTGLDDLIGSARRGGERDRARALTLLQKRLLDALDRSTNGDYGRARENYAGHSALLNALESGQDALKRTTSPEDVEEQLAHLTQNERQHYLAGLAQALRDKVTNVSTERNAVRDFLYSPVMQLKMGKIFPKEADYQAFMQRMKVEDDKFRTFAELGNSATAQRLESAADLTDGIEKGVDETALLRIASGAGGRAGMIAAAWKWATEGNIRGLKERTRTELVKMLTSTDERDMRRIAEIVQSSANRVVARRQIGRSVRAGLAQGAAQGMSTFGHTPEESWSAGQRPPPGFRQAVNKKWYKQDPDRPGKWLRWEPDAR